MLQGLSIFQAQFLLACFSKVTTRMPDSRRKRTEPVLPYSPILLSLIQPATQGFLRINGNALILSHKPDVIVPAILDEKLASFAGMAATAWPGSICAQGTEEHITAIGGPVWGTARAQTPRRGSHHNLLAPAGPG